MGGVHLKVNIFVGILCSHHSGSMMVSFFLYNSQNWWFVFKATSKNLFKDSVPTSRNVICNYEHEAAVHKMLQHFFFLSTNGHLFFTVYEKR